jgi:Na+/H+ antiporter NhaC
MGFVDSFIAWLVLILIVAFILFTVLAYILGWFYPREQVIVEEEPVQESDNEDERRVRSRKRLIWIFAIAAILAIMATTGYNVYSNTQS